MSGLFKKDRYHFLNMNQGYVGHVFDVHAHFSNHPDPEIRQLYINLTFDRYNTPKPDKETLKKEVTDALHYLKLKTILKLLRANSLKIKTNHESKIDITPFLEQQMKLENLKKEICKQLNIDILK